ncbi:DNA topoisomerase I [Candidatus Daviesbacteria bacterium RIFCSPHIGHO2_01_FULL_40_11]|uniref:DNA topoisomerase 1 n=1 Tax=Candidatus Daviesbacteria bacterium RIFCSPHIGHO2_01_FULL_40_11 TaxID=1797762 RepID=A0A1F5JFP0_9BACT|nr:MAG: DNA topoisomerase I [Candidatus Daviesbacteria bacterium RIFCSPHIGHO2_01_FULL_40_11]OGE62699.1 MAG: DNA topoisomerase I [Candidatus Daviesbacteria bacterium RIFCSPLOWO2_01_FULL_40_27]
MNNLVIVESPTKARTLQKFLGDKYQIEASMGHVRDLPKSDFGVDVSKNFEPKYIIPRDKKKRVNELKKVAGEADTLWLATDPDREGEAIAWHIAQILGDKDSNIHRVVFHEITEEAIKKAFEVPRDINLKLVDAQQARRVLDRLVGYKLSPLLWEKVKRGLSAGRVQSVALRLIVEREKEIAAFKTEEYWIIEVELSPAGPAGSDSFLATLIEKDGKKLEIKNKEEADGHVKNLEKSEYRVSKVTKKEVRRFPYPPFTTSTLQQAAANKLGMSAKKTMMLAQALYEHGLITYMRTDSVNLSVQAIGAVRSYIESFIGKAYLPTVARIFKSKSKNVQEAHEAIRVTDVSRQSSVVRQVSGLNKDHVRLYDLIWKRFVACQMNEAVMDQTTIDVTADSYLLRATGSVVKFDGWLKLYGKEVEEEGDEKKQALPKLLKTQPLNLVQLLPGQHFTEPPPRYNEASLIKKLEELGIGRPSTYAPILSTIQERFYVEKENRKFIPTALGIAVIEFLVKYFSDIIDYSFTARMEDELDEIARGEREWRPTISSFYEPFEKKLEETEKVAKKVKMEVQLAGKKCPQCGKELIIRIGKFGKFLACSGFPDCKHTESLEEKINVKCPDDGGEIIVRHTKRGKTFYGCKNWPVCKFASWTKPKGEDKKIAA